jgi:hypothetical protein
MPGAYGQRHHSQSLPSRFAGSVFWKPSRAALYNRVVRLGRLFGELRTQAQRCGTAAQSFIKSVLPGKLRYVKLEVAGRLYYQLHICASRIRGIASEDCALGVPALRRQWCIVLDPIPTTLFGWKVIKTPWERTFLAWMWEPEARGL